MSAGVLVLGLDAAEPTLLERWSEDGSLPGLAAVRRNSTQVRLGGPLETLPGGIWPELQTGRSVGKVGQYYHPRQLHTGEALVRPLSADEINGESYYWAVAARAGRRVCVIDQPLSVLVPGLDGATQLVEWGTHDHLFGTASAPSDLLDELRQHYGDHPVHGCDAYGATIADRGRLLADLERGVAAKTELLSSLLARRQWDLFTAAFTESHCAGHQLWGLLAQAPAPGIPRELEDGIRSVYQRIDAGIARLVDEAGPECVTLVVASHGMGPMIGGPQLVHEALHRLGVVRGGKARRFVPPSVRAWLRRRAPAVTRPVSRATGLQSPQTKAVALENNRCAAVRLNLAGREPQGAVRPGPEADALLASISAELQALRDPTTGEPIVLRVYTATEAFGPSHHPDVPDLLVSFRTDLGRLETCESPTLGRITVRLDAGITRTGDHTPRSRLWINGWGLGNASIPEDANVMDIAPTVLSLLAVPIPPDVDGKPLLARSSRAGAVDEPASTWPQVS
jgi:predicted AlkP superfamily phosphohydrolase/phosphomutase